MVLAKALPEVNIVVQDRPKVIEEAKKVLFNLLRQPWSNNVQHWEQNLPEAVKSGRVILERAWSAVP